MLKRLGLPVLYLVIVFFCGLAIGVSAYRLYELKSVSANEPGARPSPEEWKRRHIRELQNQLHLTPAQTTQVSEILDEAHNEIHALMERSRPEMDRIQSAQYAKVKSILTPDQLAAYERFHADRERRRMQDRKNF